MPATCTDAQRAACDDGDACTDDGCEPPAGTCSHAPRAATEPAGVQCAVDTVRGAIGTASAQCTGRCHCDLGPALAHLALPLQAIVQSPRASACRQAVRHVTQRAAAFRKRVHRLSTRGCLAPPAGAGALLDAVDELAARAGTRARSDVCTRR